MLEPTLTQKDLIEACEQPGCPACWLAHRTVARYITALFYEHVNDVKLRAGIRASRGYCQEHTWALLDASLGNALGVSIIYHDILTNILRAIPEPDPDHSQSSAGSRFGSMLARFGQSAARRIQAFRQAFQPESTGGVHAACPACTMREATLNLALPAFVRGFKTESLAQAYQASDGFCLPHLQRLLGHVEDADVAEWLLSLTRTRLETLDAELAEFIRKNDHRFNQEAWGSERDAWKRVIPLMAGENIKQK